MFTFANLMTETCFSYGIDTIVKCENALLQFLQWRTLVPTPSEIVKLLLCVAKITVNFTSLVKRAEYVIFHGLFDYGISTFKYSSIALASLLCIFDVDNQVLYKM